MTTKVLVIVEDEEEMRVLVRALLVRDPRLEILGEATTAAEAVELARALEPGLIVLDHLIDGPVMGLDAAPMLRAAAPAAKILLFSAYDLAAEARRSPAVDAYLAKDVPERLLGLAQEPLGLGPVAA
ncbi:MAG: response regulator [Acidimicrobiia bacterium]|nr:response regulator [Acidimicrobiia bacterium]